jgi:mitochondrial-processing peptidase subunit alpha
LYSWQDFENPISKQGPAACIGLYVNSGSIYETASESGISHLLERLAFKDTRNRSHAQIVGEIELTGGDVGVSASREQMSYRYHTLKAYFPQAVELLLDCVRNPIFLEREVQREVQSYIEFV